MINKVMIITLAILFITIELIPLKVSADISDPIGTSQNIFYIDTKTGGESVITLTIDNLLDQSVPIEVVNWYDYTNMGEGETSINPEWVTDIDPDYQTVPNDGAMTSNITINIPDDAEEVKYKSWIKVKVYDYPDIGGYWEKPITVIIRKGKAIQEVEFGVTPSYYRMLANTSSAYISVDSTDDIPLTINNKSGIGVNYCATAEARSSDIIVDANSSIKVSDTDINTYATIDKNTGDWTIAYKAIKDDEAKSWFSTAYTWDNPLYVEARTKGNLVWSLKIPDSLDNGHYVFGVRVAPLESSGNNVVTNYVVWILLDVDRDQHFKFNYYWLLCLLIIPFIIVLIRSKKRKTRRNFKNWNK